jgi:hypothetical protein
MISPDVIVRDVEPMPASIAVPSQDPQAGMDVYQVPEVGVLMLHFQDMLLLSSVAMCVVYLLVVCEMYVLLHLGFVFIFTVLFLTLVFP